VYLALMLALVSACQPASVVTPAPAAGSAADSFHSLNIAHSNKEEFSNHD